MDISFLAVEFQWLFITARVCKGHCHFSISYIFLNFLNCCLHLLICSFSWSLRSCV